MVQCDRVNQPALSTLRTFGVFALTVLFVGSSLTWAETRQERIASHLAAGEFGLATEVARLSTDAAEKTALMSQIANAQLASGDVDGARTSIRRMPRSEERRSLSERTNRHSGNGGAVQPDFSELIPLITTVLNAKWEQIDGEGGDLTPFGLVSGGVRVDPKGLLRTVSSVDTTGSLAALGMSSRKAVLNDDLKASSALRMVSLTRLERELASRLERGQPLPDSMQNLAGISQVQYLFVIPETHDIVIAGPAGEWSYDATGRAVSVTSQTPVLQLDDLVVVLRAFAKGTPDFGCSLNTREAGVQALQKYVDSSTGKGPISSKAVSGWVAGMQKKLGHQDVVVWGVPNDSHVARVLVEADYRLKLIGIDKLDAGKEIPSYFDLLPVALQKNAPGMEALRWWLTMKYDAILHSPDRHVYQLQGSSVLCQSENQMLTAEGKHLPTGISEPTNRQFAENFTANYDKLAARQMVFAETRNVFDLALVAAIIHRDRMAFDAGWDFGVLANEGAYLTASYPVPREIESVVNHRVYNGKDIVVQVAGGVQVDLRSVLADKKVNQESPRLESMAKTATAPALPEGRWWWDAK